MHRKPEHFIPGQFENPGESEGGTKRQGLRFEVIRKGVDIFVAGVGTGGTITGVGTYLKEKESECEDCGGGTVGFSSAFRRKAGPHKLQDRRGIRSGVLIMGIYDEILTISSEEAFSSARQIAQKEGICGISSGAAFAAAEKLAKRPENEEKTIVVLLPDSGDRYLHAIVYRIEAGSQTRK